MNGLARGRQGGFSLLELMVAAALFVVVCGAAFGLLIECQRAYSTQSQLLSSFQEARLGLDQIVRDVNIAGYPSPGQFADAPSDPANFAETPVAWAPGYRPGPPGTVQNPCTIGTAGTCTTPSDIDLIVETNVDPLVDQDVEWVRYRLQGTTLFRGIAQKANGADPVATTAAVLVPFVQNVINASPAQIASFQAAYPGMFPGGQPVPIFRYFCGAPGGIECSAPGGNNAPAKIRDIEVTLIVASPQLDATTGKPRLVVLNGRGHLVNPNP